MKTGHTATQARARTLLNKGLRTGGWILAVIVCLILADRFALIERLTGGRNHLPSMKVAKTGLDITVQAEGELRAVNTRAIVLPRVRRYSRLKIIWMVPEGDKVTKDQPVVKLDPQELVKTLKEEQFKFETAQKTLEKERAELKTRLAGIELEIESARMNVEKQKMKVNIDPSLESHLGLQEARIDLEIGRRQLEGLLKKKEALQEEGRAKITFFTSKRDRAKNAVEKIQNEIDSFTIKSPLEGIVIYKTSWRGDKPKVGESAWRGEPIMEIPDLSEMEMIGDVKEEDARFVEMGSATEIRLDAHPDKTYPGQVTFLSLFAKKRDMNQSGKSFDIKFKLKETDQEVMRPGMRAKAVITVERIPDVIAVPIDAVFGKDGRSVVYVKKGFGHETRQVQVGRKNDTHIVIREGLDPGEEIYLERPHVS